MLPPSTPRSFASRPRASRCCSTGCGAMRIRATCEYGCWVLLPEEEGGVFCTGVGVGARTRNPCFVRERRRPAGKSPARLRAHVPCPQVPVDNSWVQREMVWASGGQGCRSMLSRVQQDLVRANSSWRRTSKLLHDAKHPSSFMTPNILAFSFMSRLVPGPWRAAELGLVSTRS